MSEIQLKLASIQQALNAPKGQYNTFGKYSYRNCEDILQAVKPLLGDCVILISDDIQIIGDRVYVKATVEISLGNDKLSTTAFARESLTKKGMDESQITGAASSYARKYALNGLLLIDDNKDADSHDNASASQFSVDETAKGWITAVKHDSSVLDTIQDIQYREFIKQQAGV